MAIPSSGELTFTDFQDELGGVNPISMSEYYGQGSPALPASGEIKASDFYGVTLSELLTITEGTNGAFSGYGDGSTSAPAFGSIDDDTVGSLIVESCGYHSVALQFQISMTGNLAQSAFTSLLPEGGSTLLTASANNFVYNATFDYSVWAWDAQSVLAPQWDGSGTSTLLITI